ncbi:MAG: hypothetical protein KME08_06840 [Aphanothece sp. CMT-3BRIN-NPC111]|jgi:hypothetical protein|nr:hypothetical protein [Aphanothece sp. CMT-3BRIN-NPC111]
MMNALSLFSAVLIGCVPVANPVSNIPTQRIIIELQAPQGLAVSVGQELPFQAEANQGTVQWRVADKDKEKAFISATGKLKALKPGGIEVVADVKGKQVKAFVASIAAPPTAKSIRLASEVADWAQPDAKNGATIINNQTEWSRFWYANFRRSHTGTSLNPDLSPPPLPNFDFRSRSVVALIDYQEWNERNPVLTHMDVESRPTLFVVFPRIYDPEDLMPAHVPHRRVFLFEVDKVPADAQVVVERLKN